MNTLLARHAQVLLDCLGRLARRPFSTALTVAGIGVALAVPLVLYVLVVNLAAMFGQGQPSARLSLYIDAADESAMERIASRIEDEPDVDTVVLIGRDVALDELLRTGGLEELRGHLGPNPLPDMIEVYPRAGLDSTDYEALASRFAAIDGVGEVQVDLEWVSRLRALTDLALVVVRAFWVLLFAGVALVIANSVRLSLMTARDEVEVISLVGGSDAFIRRPYLYLGLLYGVGGAVLAVAIALAVHVMAADPLGRLLEAYLGVSEVRFAGARVLAGVVAGAGVIGWLTSWITVSRFLGEIRPR